MAGPAGISSLHIFHGEAFFLFNIENCVVARPAIVGEAFLGYVVRMTEYDFTSIFGDIYGVFYCYCTCIALKHQENHERNYRKAKIHV